MMSLCPNAMEISSPVSFCKITSPHSDDVEHDCLDINTLE